MTGIDKLIFICVGLWLATKTGLLFVLPFEQNVSAGVMMNLFFILLIAVFTIRRKVKDTLAGQSHFLDDLKTVVRATSKYVIFAIIALGIFNYAIAKDTIALKNDKARSEIEESFATEESYQAKVAENPNLVGIDREEAKEKSIEAFEFFGKWYVQMTLALLALMATAIAYSLLASLLWRNLMR